jgi:hypothetical protein
MTQTTTFDELKKDVIFLVGLTGTHSEKDKSLGDTLNESMSPGPGCRMLKVLMQGMYQAIVSSSHVTLVHTLKCLFDEFLNVTVLFCFESCKKNEERAVC